MLDLWLVCQFIYCGYKMEIRWSVWQRQATCFDQDPQRLQSSLVLYLNRKLAVLRSFSLLSHFGSCWSTLCLFCQKLSLLTENKTFMFHTKPSFSSHFTSFGSSFWAAESTLCFPSAKLLAIILSREVFLLLLSCQISKGKNSPTLCKSKCKMKALSVLLGTLKQMWFHSEVLARWNWTTGIVTRK